MSVYIVMGVSGVGKTTIGILLSKRLGLPFFDADDFHPMGNIQKMKAGYALNDADRKDWLEILAKKIKTWNEQAGAVLACSALKESYRKKLRVIPETNLHWIFLYSDFETILKRIGKRKNHFFKADLLKSQYEILENPDYGISVNVNTTKEKIIDKIMETINKNRSSKIGILGLGPMGKALAQNLASKGAKVAVYNRQVKDKEVDVAKKFAIENKADFSFSWHDEISGFVNSLKSPRTILLMVKAGAPVDKTLRELEPFLAKKDLVIDGGNSHFKDTNRRTKALAEKGILFMGLGISGGEKGARNGPSFMAGGSKTAYDSIGCLLEKIAAKDKSENACCAHVGPEGAGHFTKMVHNGIEYAEMQLIAEVYAFLRSYLNYSAEEIAVLFESWNAKLKSYLIEISIKILRKKEGNRILLDLIIDAAEQKGTGSWTTEAALELGIPLNTITEAVMARHLSAMKTLRLAATKKYDDTKNAVLGKEKNREQNLFEAYQFGRIIVHAQGFHLLHAASEKYHWNLNLPEIARIWTNGCIIKSGFMQQAERLLKEAPNNLLLFHKEVISQIQDYKTEANVIVCEAIKNHVPMPVLSSAINNLLGFTSAQLPANLIQAQRDFFGAHTFERTDKPRGEFFHALWEEA